MADGRPHIAHLDMDAFYASVELLRYPELRGKAVVIGGGRRHQPAEYVDPLTHDVVRTFSTLRGYVGRGVITTATYEARALGLHSAMGMMKAAALAPDAILLPVDFDAYRHYSRLFKNAVRAIAPRIEDRGIDEIYIDITGVVSNAADEPADATVRALAQSIKDAVRSATGLSCSIGIAPNKLLAKIASDLDKPDGLTVIGDGDLERRIWPLPARRINGIGPKSAARLETYGIRTIGDLARTEHAFLVETFGRAHGQWMHERTNVKRSGVRSTTKWMNRAAAFRRSGAIFGVDGDVVVREVARPDGRARVAATEIDTNRDLRLLHHALAGFFGVRRCASAALDDEHVIEPERNGGRIQIARTVIADRAHDPAEVRIRREECRFHQRRVRDAERDAPAFGDVATAFDADPDELRRAFAVADDRLRKLDGHAFERLAQHGDARIGSVTQRLHRCLAGRDEDEAVVRRRVAVDRRAVERHIGGVAREPIEQRAFDRRIGGGESEHRRHAQSA